MGVVAMPVIPGWPGQRHRTLFKKKTETRRTRDVAQVVEHLQARVLSSIPDK
jgi:hypothetical protein